MRANIQSSSDTYYSTKAVKETKSTKHSSSDNFSHNSIIRVNTEKTISNNFSSISEQTDLKIPSSPSRSRSATKELTCKWEFAEESQSNQNIS